MPDYRSLRAELDRPAYAGLSDAAAADRLNAATETRPVLVACTPAERIGWTVRPTEHDVAFARSL